MGSFGKFSENKLPDKCKFFSSLKDECISEEDYLKAIDVWNVFKNVLKIITDFVGLKPKMYSLIAVDN